MKKKVTTTTTVTEEIVSDEEKLTLVAVVVDRSGSMNPIYQAALSGVNEQLNGLKVGSKKKGVGKTLVSFIQFDTEIETLVKLQPVEEVEPFKNGDFFPRGGTSMYDATHKAIQELKSYKNTPEDTSYLIIVISDGYENSSKEVNASQSGRGNFKKLQATDKWTFSYMLSNQDLSVVRNTLGLQYGNVMGWTYSNAGVADAYANNSIASANFLTSRGTGLKSSKTFYTPDAGTLTDVGALNVPPVVINTTTAPSVTPEESLTR